MERMIQNQQRNFERGDFFPKYIDEIRRNLSPGIEVSLFGKFWIKFALGLITFYIRLRMGNWKKGRKANVQDCYTKAAPQYEARHTKITNGHDMWWRREAGYAAAFFLKKWNRENSSAMPILLDIGTGIGMSLEEMFRIFDLEDVRVKAIGIDINEAMLKRAKKKVLQRIADNGWSVEGIREIQFEFGDATKLLGAGGKSEKNSTFVSNSAACITSIVGMGGISNPLPSFQQQLEILEPNGIAIMLDIHRPLPQLSASWPYDRKKWWPAFQQMAWEDVTIPLVLNEMWAWNDPTFNFYTMPLVTYFDKDLQKHFGFELFYREVRTQTWWFGLPVVHSAKMILKKIEITQEESKQRNNYLQEWL